jgi:hypothetical protein
MLVALSFNKKNNNFYQAIALSLRLSLLSFLIFVVAVIIGAFGNIEGVILQIVVTSILFLFLHMIRAWSIKTRVLD